jgi:hypothetical protein
VRPVSFSFGDGGFTVTIRGRKYTRGEGGGDSLPAMYVRARYKVERAGDVARLVRQGDLEIFPPRVERGGSPRLSVEEVSVKSLLSRKFGKMLSPEIVSEGLELPGKWKKLGKLALRQVIADNGWMALAWNRRGRSGEQIASTHAR